jgi:N-methylhydantoinase B
MQNHLTNTQNTPVEVIERQYPIRVIQYALISDSCGAGTYRGGCGIRRDLYFEGEHAMLTIGADRRVFRPWGLEGGTEARGAYAHIIRADGTTENLPTKVCSALRKGDSLIVETPGGGGWGDPAMRDAASVREDLANGFISKAYQLKHYP